MKNPIREFPSIPDNNGWFFESAEYYGLGIESRIKDGIAQRKVPTKKGTALVSQLSASDYIRLKSGKHFKTRDVSYILEVLAACTKINGSHLPVEFYTKELTHANLNSLIIAVTDLNFINN